MLKSVGMSKRQKRLFSYPEPWAVLKLISNHNSRQIHFWHKTIDWFVLNRPDMDVRDHLLELGQGNGL